MRSLRWIAVLAVALLLPLGALGSDTPTPTETPTPTNTPTPTPYGLTVTVGGSMVEGTGQVRVYGTIAFPTGAHGGYAAGGSSVIAASFGLSSLSKLIVGPCSSNSYPTPSTAVVVTTNSTGKNAQAFWSGGSATPGALAEVTGTTDLSGMTCNFVGWGAL